MNTKTYHILLYILLIAGLKANSQTVEICNSFENSITNIHIDNSADWKIGTPSKGLFDSSYSSPNSIVTSLDSMYSNNSTSVFYATYYDSDWNGIPHYLNTFKPLEIEFMHRFNTDSETDFGTIELSVDHGVTWVDILTDQSNANYNIHVFEGTGDTIYDSISISGNSNGWVHSKMVTDINFMVPLFTIPDSIMVKFSFTSDGNGRKEGWQIDDLCIRMDYLANIEPITSIKNVIYPNPNNGSFYIQNASNVASVSIYDATGKKIYFKDHPSNFIHTDLPLGMYYTLIRTDSEVIATKLLIK